MNDKLVRNHFIVLLLNVAILLTLAGLIAAIRLHIQVDAPPIRSAPDQPQVSAIHFNHSGITNIAASQQTAAGGTENAEIPADFEPVAASFEVTADYLNIRSGADSTSKIIKVVNKGTVLQVLSTTENGWLELRGGGFVNAKYAKRLIASDAIQEKTAEPSPQPAVHADMSGPPRQPSSFIKSKSGLSEANLEQIFKGTALAGQGLETAVLEIEGEYGINAFFTIAVMKLESGHGSSKIAADKNNLFGLNAIDGDEYNKALNFKTKAESVRKFGEIISNYYLSEGYNSVEEAAKKYCAANPNWPVLVKRIMAGDYYKL